MECTFNHHKKPIFIQLKSPEVYFRNCVTTVNHGRFHFASFLIMVRYSVFGVLLSPDTGDLSTIEVTNSIIIILAVLTTRQHVAIGGYRLYVIMQ